MRWCSRHLVMFHDPRFYFAPCRDVKKYCDQHVCLSVCLSVCPLTYLKTICANLTKFLCALAVAISDDRTLYCYVLPVLWMTSCVFLSGRWIA